AYGYAITPALRATASVSSAFRAPTLYQRFSAYGDASLKPETGRNVELGLRYANGPTQASVVAYRNRVSNLIIFDSGATACGEAFGCYNSVGRAAYRGVTFAAGHRIGDTTLRGSIDLQNPKDLDTGRQLQRRAKRHATFGADTTLAGWTLGGEVQASGRRFENAANTDVLGGYALVNLYASTRIARDVTLLARVDNLAGKDYQVARTYVTPGRTLYVGLKWAPQR
ncbi:MAG: TonB-dependent receptor, partial [Hydrogenophaga sp.]|uniref:TonB-dependent receptor domain-containing protein n=1 Tax=Hydrogenophaga sp. TaxID=1904254 RepID=UPI00260867D6